VTRPPAPPSGRPSRIGLAALAVVLTLAAVEGGLRTFTALSDRGLRGIHQARPDRPWLYGLRPGVERRLGEPRPATYRINSAGFRDRERGAAPTADRFRILVLGDSLSFGYGVEGEESFPAQIESLATSRAPEAHIEVLNHGVGGYNPYNEAALLEDIGESLEPDLVLVQFCINDLNDPTLHFDANTRLALGEIPDAAFPNPEARTRTAADPSALSAVCSASRLCELLVSRLGPGPDVGSWEAAFSARDASAEREWRWLSAQYGRLREAAAHLDAPLFVLAFRFPHSSRRATRAESRRSSPRSERPVAGRPSTCCRPSGPRTRRTRNLSSSTCGIRPPWVIASPPKTSSRRSSVQTRCPRRRHFAVPGIQPAPRRTGSGALFGAAMWASTSARSKPAASRFRT
jgi:lysophospholipase L1-like esterase